MLGTHALTLGKALLRNGYLVAATLALAVMFAYPAFRPVLTGGMRVAPEYYASQLYSNEALMQTPEFQEGATSELVGHLETENGLLAQIALATTEEEVIESIAAYEGYHRERLGAGGGSMPAADLLGLSANSLAIELVADLEHPVVYDSTVESPLLVYALFTFHSIPYVLWFAPLAVAAYACARARSGDGLLAAAPVPRPVEFASAALVVFAAAAAAFAAACLPGLLVTVLRNGVGDPEYPVVFIRSGEVVCSTVGESLAQCLALYGASALLLSVLSSLAMSATGSALASQAVLMLLVAVPLAPGYYGSGQDPAPPARSWLPTTYLDACRTVGYPTFSNGATVNEIAGCTFGRGILVLGLCTAAAAAVAALFFACASLARRRGAGKGGGHALGARP